MNKLEFANKEVKELYRTVANSQSGLNGVIVALLNKNTIKIQNIYNEEYDIQIEALYGEEIINIEISFLKNKIYVKLPNKSYKEVYDNYPKQDTSPIAIEYQNNNRILTRRFVNNINTKKEETYHYDFISNDHSYNIMIDSYMNNFNEELFVNTLLHTTVIINNIRDVLMIILNDFNDKYVNILLTDGLGSTILIKHGEITNYLEYRECDHEYQKIYLDQGKFYIERKIKEVYQDSLTSYVKKIGESYGKEKR